MAILTILDVTFYLALGLCVIGFGLKGVRFLHFRLPANIPSAAGRVDAPPRQSWWSSLWRFFTEPAGYFHRKASRSWTCGYICYHAAILMVVLSYSVSVLILAVHIAGGEPIPLFREGWGKALSPANGLALVFGNAESGPSAYLFGTWAPLFRTLAVCEMPLAVVGNLCLLYALVKGRQGAVRHDLDPAARDIRLEGVFSGQHLAIRLVIFSIIAMEFIGRFGWIPSIAYYHALLGMILIAALPLTYLAHIPLAPLAVGLAVRRRRRNALA